MNVTKLISVVLPPNYFVDPCGKQVLSKSIHLNNDVLNEDA